MNFIDSLYWSFKLDIYEQRITTNGPQEFCLQTWLCPTYDRRREKIGLQKLVLRPLTELLRQGSAGASPSRNCNYMEALKLDDLLVSPRPRRIYPGTRPVGSVFDSRGPVLAYETLPPMGPAHRGAKQFSFSIVN